MANLKKSRNRGPQPGVLRETPYYPSRVLKIIRMRESGLKLQEIADVFGLTPAGVSHIVKRWGDWANNQQKADAR